MGEARDCITDRRKDKNTRTKKHWLKSNHARPIALDEYATKSDLQEIIKSRE
jgi:hypothetical protein